MSEYVVFLPETKTADGKERKACLLAFDQFRSDCFSVNCRTEDENFATSIDGTLKRDYSKRLCCTLSYIPPQMLPYMENFGKQGKDFSMRTHTPINEVIKGTIVKLFTGVEAHSLFADVCAGIPAAVEHMKRMGIEIPKTPKSRLAATEEDVLALPADLSDRSSGISPTK